MYCLLQVYRNNTDDTQIKLSYNDTLSLDANATTELPPVASLLGAPLGTVDATFILADVDLNFADGSP
jgi:hypothetical protein